MKSSLSVIFDGDSEGTTGHGDDDDGPYEEEEKSVFYEQKCESNCNVYIWFRFVKDWGFRMAV